MNTSKFLFTFGLISSAICAQAGNVLPNGDFSAGLTDWNLTYGTVTAVSPSAGQYAASFSSATHLVSYGYSSSIYYLGLSNYTTVGHTYELSYTVTSASYEAWYASIDNVAASQWWNGATTYQPNGFGIPFTGTETFHETYVAGASDFLYFSYTGFDSSGTQAPGEPGLLSNVSIQATPEPVTTALCIGAIGVAIRRRRKN